MTGISTLTYTHSENNLLTFFCESSKNGKIQLFQSLYETVDWGTPKNIISLSDSDGGLMTFSLTIRSKNFSNGEKIKFDILPSLLNGDLVIGIGPGNYIVLWDYYIKKSIIHKHLQINSQNILANNWMKQFTYRYQVILENWDKEKWMKYDEEKDEVQPEFDYIEEKLYDGTHDKLHDGGLMKYHEAGKPKKLAIKWRIKKSDYSAFFWFEEEEICTIFNKFYGQYPDTKTDFIIHIDPIKKKYELSLYCYGLKQPVIIPENAYQLIVFKSGFENYRSDNYNQPTGAWIW